MAVQSEEILFFLSGGPFNNDPEKSLGGEMSNAPLLSGINGLFSNISPSQAASGHISYRCLYVYNRSGTSSLKNAAISINHQARGGAMCFLGIPETNAVNSVAMQIFSSLQEPTGVMWYPLSVNVGDLQPGDSIPVWIKRTVVGGIKPVQKDGITVIITGES